MFGQQGSAGASGGDMAPDLGVAEASPAATLRVDASSAHAVNSFDPEKALGSSMDILSSPVVDKIYTPPMIQEWLAAGWGPISYRNNTELSVAAWHWNRNGTWSDPNRQCGYFTGSSEPVNFLRHSFGYPLPHSGDSRGARGYSRLTDGDPATFWKSNPYLTRAFTGEDDFLHPQWVVIDLGVAQKVNAIRIDWCEPSARVYEVQYWTGDNPLNWESEYSRSTTTHQIAGQWHTFPNGTVQDGRGGKVTLNLSGPPVATRWIRIVMTQSSNRPGPHGAGDARHSVGYSIYEVYAGTLQDDGTFIDLMTHAPDARQTQTRCSSVDPWHSASDLNPHGDQTGFDLFFTSGITNNLPAMIPVAVLYGTPEDAAAQMAYMKKRGYPIAWVEMGEECDGKQCMPEDYAALYLQFAAAMHKVDPDLKLGGPVFQGVNQDISVWPDARGGTSWFARFLDYLKSHDRIQDLAFMSFEHYPFNPSSVTWSDLYREPEITHAVLQAWRDDGLPPHVPMMITESNLSWALTEEMVEIFSALWLADSVGSFFLEGGTAYYHSPIQAEPLRPGIKGWATYGNFVADANLRILQHTAQFFASQIINLEWAKHHGGVHHLHRVSGTVKDAAGNNLITSYALQRPDGEWALLLVNKDPENARTMNITFEYRPNEKTGYFAGPVRMVTFGSEQYVWQAAGVHSHADPCGPPRTVVLAGGEAARYTLPKASITVLRGKVAFGES